MARRYEQRLRAEAAEETRRRILDAAHERLREAPAERLNVEWVARSAGVARSTMYLIFGSRAGLFDALGADLLERGGFDRLMAAVKHPDAREGVRGGIRSGVHMYAAHRNPLRALFSMAALDADAVAGAVERMEHGRAGGMTSLSSRLADQGALRPGVAPSEAADLLWVLTSFDTFDLLYTGRSLSAGRVAARIVAAAERSLFG
jgi:AcrR family transcriptional regulator